MSHAHELALAAVLLAAAACGGNGKDGGGPPQPVSYAVRIALTGPGSVDVTGDAAGKCQRTCSLSVKAGGRVVLTPVPDAEASFEGFGGACSGSGPCPLEVNADVDVTGTFEATPSPANVTLTIVRAGDGQGEVTSDPAGVSCAASACTGVFASGATVTLTATPDARSRFEGWEGGGCSGTTTCALVLTAATSVTARFALGAPGTYALKVLSHPDGTLTAGSGIDARGDVAGTLFASECCESQVFVYDAATDRVTLPLPDHRGARGVVMNDEGMLIVSLEDGKYYRFEDGAVLSALGAMTPQALNVHGWAAGWMEAGPGPLHAAVDDGTTLRDLDPGGTAASTASGINAAGIVVGSREGKAVVFEAGGPRELPVPAGSVALDVSDDGKVVGAANRRFKWTEQAFLAELASGDVTLVDRPSDAAGISLDRINRAGTIAVGQLYSGFGTGDGCVYRNGKLERLGDLVELPPGMRILHVGGVNDRGQILLTLVDGHGRTSPAILTPR
ncbi:MULTISPECIES: hypothetical protein [unclassified Anaeromyxobacter]|uniref:InlB B-repeat-containing protein n=1 Tax=unclassified Anaeromyxobacter TaxID=2620896 RepID=UPI001F576513|nr:MULTISPECIES: hypothetical protein [unclassified Anaeromyxobacter]